MPKVQQSYAPTWTYFHLEHSHSPIVFMSGKSFQRCLLKFLSEGHQCLTLTRPLTSPRNTNSPIPSDRDLNGFSHLYCCCFTFSLPSTISEDQFKTGEMLIKRVQSSWRRICSKRWNVESVNERNKTPFNQRRFKRHGKQKREHQSWQVRRTVQGLLSVRSTKDIVHDNNRSG